MRDRKIIKISHGTKNPEKLMKIGPIVYEIMGSEVGPLII